jgi:hypothetical protein
MPTIAWNENTPADGDSAGQGDDQFRSLKSSIRVGLDSEHVWPVGGGDAGVHRLGSARAYYGAQSLVSSTGTDGRFMQTSDTSQFFHVGSGGTALIGGATGILAGSFPGTVPQRHYWAVEFGVGVTNAITGVTTITYANSGFSGMPFVVVSGTNAVVPGAPRILDIWNPTVTGFSVAAYNISGFSVAKNFNWISIGSRIL